MAEKSLTPVQSGQLREMSAQYLSLFQGRCNVEAKGYLSILGDGLFHLFFETGWQDFGAKILEGGDLVVDSNIPEVLQLPWEHLRLANGVAIGISQNFSIYRRPLSFRNPLSLAEIAPGPLRVLFLASESLDYEEEEQGMLKAVEGLEMVLEISDLATLEELRRQVRDFRPHIVHLAVKGKIVGGEARISVQGEGSKQDLRSAEELAVALDKCGVSCVILGGLQMESLASLELFSQKLAEYIPLVIAWNSSSYSMRTFYFPLTLGRPLNESLRLARQDIYKAFQDKGGIADLPTLYASVNLQEIYDPQESATVVVPAISAIHKEQSPLPGMVEGYAESFVNRRTEISRLTAALTDGRVHTLILTGSQGVGKSALATKLAAKMESLGYSIMPVYSSKSNQLSLARLLDAVQFQLNKTGNSKAAQKLLIGPANKRTNSLIEVLKKSRFLILLDGLGLDGKTNKILDTELAFFYLQMLSDLGSSRIIFTCQNLPADALTLPSRAWEWQLSGLSKAAFIRFLLQDENLAKRYRKGEILYEELVEIHSKASSYAGGPALLRQALNIGVFDESFDVIKSLSDSLDHESHLALMRAAVYGVAVSLSGLAAVTRVREEKALSMARDWQELSLAYPVGNLWTVSSSVRALLLTSLSPEERCSANIAAGNFIRSIAESGNSADLGLTRLDLMLEARGHFLASEDLPEARNVTARVSGYLERRGYYSELIRLNQEILEKELHTVPMHWIARAYLNQGDNRKAQQWYERIIEIGPDAVAFYGLGTTFLSSEKHDLARENLQKAMEIWQKAGDLTGEAAVLQGLASLDMEQKDEKAAQVKLAKVVEIRRNLGDSRGEAAALQELAMLDYSLQNYEAARPRLARSIELLEKVGDQIGEAAALFHLANLDMEKGDFQLSKEEFQKVLTHKREIGERSGEAIVLHSLGLIESQAGSKETAGKNFKEALRIYQELADKPGEAGAFFQLGALAVQKNKIPEGVRLMAHSALILRIIKSDDVKNVEPLVERLASQLGYSQDQFMTMVQEVTQGYRKDKGWGLVEKALKNWVIGGLRES